MRGSLQVFVDKGERLSWSDAREYSLSDSFEGWNLIVVFDYLIGNTDRDNNIGRKNYLEWESSGFFSLAAYDHSMAFVRPGFQRGRFGPTLRDINWSLRGVPPLMYNIKFQLTPKKYREILKKRNHSEAVISERLKVREALIKTYEDQFGEITKR